ncbi:hypothetical protein Tco_0167646 [Tanacetum coccineum]
MFRCWLALASRQPGPTIETSPATLLDTERKFRSFCTHDIQRCLRRIVSAVRAEVEVLRKEDLLTSKRVLATRQALAKSEAHCRTLEAQVTVLETEARRSEAEAVSRDPKDSEEPQGSDDRDAETAGTC